MRDVFGDRSLMVLSPNEIFIADHSERITKVVLVEMWQAEEGMLYTIDFDGTNGALFEQLKAMGKATGFDVVEAEGVDGEIVVDQVPGMIALSEDDFFSLRLILA